VKKIKIQKKGEKNERRVDQMSGGRRGGDSKRPMGKRKRKIGNHRDSSLSLGRGVERHRLV